MLWEAGGWLGACGTSPAPAAPGRTNCHVPGDHPACPARMNMQPPPLLIQCHQHGEALARPWGSRSGREAGGDGCHRGAQLLPPAVLRSLPTAAAHHCSCQQNSPALPPAREPQALGGLKQNKLLWWDYPSVPRRAEQGSASVLGSGLLSDRKQSRLIFNSFLQASTKNFPKFWGLISLQEKKDG